MFAIAVASDSHASKSALKRNSFTTEIHHAIAG
jgi:hypothetical protein